MDSQDETSRPESGDTAPEKQMPIPERSVLDPVSGSPYIPRLPDFDIHSELAGYGRGSAWTAIRKTTKRHVVLRVFPLNLMPTQESHFRAFRETQTAAELEHPLIASIYDCGLDRNCFWYALQPVSGMGLLDYIRTHALSRNKSLDTLITLCRIVQHAHMNGVIHKDLRPENVVVNEAGEPMIRDYGFLSGLCGTDDMPVKNAVRHALYNANELIDGELVNLDGRADVYSLGVILCEAFTRSFPIDPSGGPEDVIARKRTQEPRWPETGHASLPVDFRMVIMKAMASHREDRYGHAEELAQDLEALKNRKPVSAMPASPSYFLRKWIARNGLATAALGLVAAAGVHLGPGYLKPVMEKGSALIASQPAPVPVASDPAKVDPSMVKAPPSGDYRPAFLWNLADLEKALAAKDVKSAEANLADLDRLSRSEGAAEIAREYAGAIAKLRLQFEPLKREHDALRLQHGEVVVAFDEILHKHLNGYADINETLLELLDERRKRFSDVDFRTTKGVAKKLREISARINQYCSQLITSRDDIGRRKLRLVHMKKFVNDPRLLSLFPELRKLDNRCDEELKTHIVEIVNRIDRDIRIIEKQTRQNQSIPAGTRMLFTVPVDADSLAAYQAEHPDERYLPSTFEVKPEPGAGSVWSIDQFNEKTTALVLPDDDALIDKGIVLDIGSNPKGPWMPFTNRIERVSGTWYLKYGREYYQDFIEKIEISFADKVFLVVPPDEEQWAIKPYIPKIKDARKLMETGKLQKAISIVKTINPDSIIEPEIREELQRLAKALKTHPIRQFQLARPEIDRRVTTYFKALIQRYDPLATSRRKPYRFQNDDMPAMVLNVNPLAEKELNLLEPKERAAYFMGRLWSDVAHRVEERSFVSQREDIVQRIQTYIDAYGGIDESVLNRTRMYKVLAEKGGVVKDLDEFQPGFDHPMFRCWKAHQVYDRKNSDSLKLALESMALFRKEGGELDRNDLALATYAAYFIMEEVITDLDNEQTLFGNELFKEGIKTIITAFVLLEKCLDGASLKEFEAMLFRLVENSQKKEMKGSDVVMTYFMARMSIPEPSRAASTRVYLKSKSNFKADYGRVDQAEMTQKFDILNIALSGI